MGIPAQAQAQNAQGSQGSKCGRGMVGTRSHRQPVWLQSGSNTEHPWLVRTRDGKDQGLGRQVGRVSASEQ